MECVDEPVIAERWNAGATLDEIAAEMGLSRGAVAGRIRRLRKSGVALRSGHAGGIEDFAEMVAEGSTPEQAAHALGRGQQWGVRTMAAICKRLGWQAC